MKTVARVAIVAIVVLVLAILGRPLAERAWFLYNLATEEPPTALPSPLASRRPIKFVDSWGNERPGGRSHQGIDIFAPKDTPVLSTTNGMVMSVGTNNLGGNVVWILGPGLERHYYAHLDRYGAFKAGDRVAAGDVIGYAGNTGNARGGPVHLHYGIYRNGAAQNPFPRFAARPRDLGSRIEWISDYLAIFRSSNNPKSARSEIRNHLRHTTDRMRAATLSRGSGWRARTFSSAQR